MGTPNRNFDREMRLYESSRTHGTREQAAWRAYPGKALLAHSCPRYDCVAYTGPIEHETYFLCEECAKLAPCSIQSFLHAPYKQLPPKKKRLMASAVCFASFFRERARRQAALPA